MVRLVIQSVLACQLFAFPVTSAYAIQVKQNVVISITYTDVVPRDVCVYAYNVDDIEMTQAIDAHCWKPKSVMGDLDTWKDERIDMTNFKVLVRYPDGKVVSIALTSKVNT